MNFIISIKKILLAFSLLFIIAASACIHAMQPNTTENLFLQSPIAETLNLQQFRKFMGGKVKQQMYKIITNNPKLKKRLEQQLVIDDNGRVIIKINPVIPPSWTPHITHLSLSEVPVNKRFCINQTILNTLNACKDKLKKNMQATLPSTAELKLLGAFVVIALAPDLDISRDWERFSHKLDTDLKDICTVRTKHFEEYQKPGQTWVPHISLHRITPYFSDIKAVSLKEKINNLLQEKDDAGKKTIRQHIEHFLTTIPRDDFTLATLNLDYLVLSRGSTDVTQFTFNETSGTWEMKVLEQPVPEEAPETTSDKKLGLPLSVSDLKEAATGRYYSFTEGELVGTLAPDAPDTYLYAQITKDQPTDKRLVKVFDGTKEKTFEKSHILKLQIKKRAGDLASDDDLKRTPKPHVNNVFAPNEVVIIRKKYAKIIEKASKDSWRVVSQETLDSTSSSIYLTDGIGKIMQPHDEIIAALTTLKEKLVQLSSALSGAKA